MNYKSKTNEDVSDMNIYPNCHKSRLTDYDRKKADMLGYFIQMFFFTVEPDGDIPHIPPDLTHHVRIGY